MLQLRKKQNKRGQQGLQLALTLGVFTFVIAGFAIGLAAFQSSTSDANASTVIGNGITMLTNLSGQFGTIGTLIGVGLLISVIVVAFVVTRMVGRGGGGF